MKIKHILSFVLVTGLFFCYPSSSFAGGGQNPPNQNNNPQNNNQSAPFDAGIGLLIGGGVVYALKKANNKRVKDKKLVKP